MHPTAIDDEWRYDSCRSEAGRHGGIGGFTSASYTDRHESYHFYIIAYSSTWIIPSHRGRSPDPRLQQSISYFASLLVGFAVLTFTSLKEIWPPMRPRLIPGHQIVGEVIEGATAELQLGTRVGVSWMGGVDGDCWYCHHGMENLCDKPIFTGYMVDGGYAEYASSPAQTSVFPLPAGLDDVHGSAPVMRRHHRLSQFAGCGCRNLV